MNKELFKLAAKEVGMKETIGKVSRIIKNPVDNKMFIFMGTHGVSWITENCGQKIKVLNSGRKLSHFIFHPFERNWLLASSWKICKKGDTKCNAY